MPDHPSTSEARPNTIVEAHAQNSPDAHPTSIQAQSQPLTSHPAKHPPHFTAGNSFGPYLFEGLTTNRPHPQFLDSISDPALVKLDVPHYLYAHHTHAPTFAGSNATVDTFRYYLCASLARHHGYRHAYLTEATTTTHSYRSTYENFERRFTESLQSILDNEEINPVTTKEHTELVTLERDLTHETFAMWPRLFDRCFTANETLLRSLELQAPTLLHVLGSRQHPRAFLQGRMRHLHDAWIDLADGPDVLLRRRHPRRWRTCVLLAQRRGELVARVDGWIVAVARAMRDAERCPYDDDDDVVAGWQRRVDRWGDGGGRGAVRVWDDVVDGGGFAGWRGGLVGGLGEGVGGWRSGLSGGRALGRLGEGAGGEENVRPVGGGRGGEGWDPEAWMNG